MKFRGNDSHQKVRSLAFFCAAMAHGHGMIKPFPPGALLAAKRDRSCVYSEVTGTAARSLPGLSPSYLPLACTAPALGCCGADTAADALSAGRSLTAVAVD